MKQFDTVTAYFEPQKPDTLREAAKPFIGQLLSFEVMWLIDAEDNEDYAGQWAMRAMDENGRTLPFGWCPEEDIRVVEVAG